jgi:hypothetical protein
LSIQISIGILVHYKDCIRAEWLNFSQLENDGSNPAINPYAGFPARKISTVGFARWIKDDPAALQFYMKVKRQYPFSRIPEYAQITDELIKLANDLRTDGVKESHADRARWLQYWLRRAKEVWGSSAVIMLS